VLQIDAFSGPRFASIATVPVGTVIICERMEIDINTLAREIIDFVLAEMPMGVLVFNEKMGITYMNRTAEKLLDHYELPAEIPTICRRIFDAIKSGKVHDLFPGDIVLYQKISGAQNSWITRIEIGKGSVPLVYVFMSEEKVSNKLNLNKRRNQFRLTRRETDIVRRVLDGLRNNEIAEDCGISEQTVKDHLSNIFMKCGVRSRFELLCTFMNSPEPESPPPYNSRIDALHSIH
jgi:DNA-binding CsgD family transcriptional regulator